MTNDPPEYTMSSVMGLVVQELYFGRRPNSNIMAMNGSVLKALNRRGRSWEDLWKIVSGLALRRNRGDLGETRRTVPLSVCWLMAAGQRKNEAELCLDAYYSQPMKLDVSALVKEMK